MHSQYIPWLFTSRSMPKCTTLRAGIGVIADEHGPLCQTTVVGGKPSDEDFSLLRSLRASKMAVVQPEDVPDEMRERLSIVKCLSA